MSLLAVNHHYFREKSPPSGIYPINASTLSKRVGHLKNYFHFGGEESVLSYINQADSGENYCVFTFDDGLKEQIKALHLLDSMGLPAICFVPAKPLINPGLLDVHKLHMIRSVKSDGELRILLDREFSFNAVDWDHEILTTQYRYDSEESRQIKYFLNFVMEPDARRTWVDRTFTSLFGSEAKAAESLYMSREEVQLLAKKGMLGTHTLNHVPLAGLSTKQVRHEIEMSVEVLEEIGGRKVQGISYPYGGKSAISTEVFEAASDCGLMYGFTMERGINTCGQNIGAMQLKRVDTNDVEGLSPLPPDGL